MKTANTALSTTGRMASSFGVDAPDASPAGGIEAARNYGKRIAARFK